MLKFKVVETRSQLIPYQLISHVPFEGVAAIHKLHT